MAHRNRWFTRVYLLIAWWFSMANCECHNQMVSPCASPEKWSIVDVGLDFSYGWVFWSVYIYIFIYIPKKWLVPFFWLTVANFQTKPGCFWEVSLAGNTGKLFGWGPSGRGRSTETTSANSMDNGQNNVLTNGGQSSTVKHPSWPSDLSHLIPSYP